MSQLTGPEINKIIQSPSNGQSIQIKPYFAELMGPNSYDVHLAPTLRVYKSTVPDGMRPYIPLTENTAYNLVNGTNELKMQDWFTDKAAYRRFLRHPEEYSQENPQFLIDPFQANKPTVDFVIQEYGVIVSPRFKYLGATVEYTETHGFIPHIDGKSSIGRNFISVHETAGKGDDGFCGTWTLEITVGAPIIFKPYMRIAQLWYLTKHGQSRPYGEKIGSNYNYQIDPKVAAPIKVDKEILEFIENLKKNKTDLRQHYLDEIDIPQR